MRMRSSPGTMTKMASNTGGIHCDGLTMRTKRLRQDYLVPLESRDTKLNEEEAFSFRFDLSDEAYEAFGLAADVVKHVRIEWACAGACAPKMTVWFASSNGR